MGMSNLAEIYYDKQMDYRRFTELWRDNDIPRIPCFLARQSKNTKEVLGILREGKTKMNKERIMELADVIEGRKLADMGFNMFAFVETPGRDIENHPCKTAGCIGGWCKILFNSEFDFAETVLREELEISGDQAYDIAYPSLLVRENNQSGFFATPKQAATLLRNFAETGVVDWLKAMKQGD